MSAVKDKVWEIELTSDCSCYDEEGNTTDCFGCWEDSEELFYEALEGWRRKVGVTWDLVRIDGVGLGWNKDSGYAIKRFNEALKALTINGDFRITATWDGATSFTASRASHDEPTGGARFTFTLIREED